MFSSRFNIGVILILAFLTIQFNSLHLHAHTSVPHKHIISADSANHSFTEICTICDFQYAPVLLAPTFKTQTLTSNLVLGWGNYFVQEGQISLSKPNNKAPPIYSWFRQSPPSGHSKIQESWTKNTLPYYGFSFYIAQLRLLKRNRATLYWISP